MYIATENYQTRELLTMTATRLKLLYLITIALFFLIPCIGYAEITYDVLDPIKNGLKAPEDVAVSSDGKIYVVDGYQNKVFMYDRKGRAAGSIPIQKPTSVAVNNNGAIYIGTNDDFSVKIFDSSHTIIGSLGKGAGEFQLPRNVTVDKATGNVYVVDQLDYSIKVYTSNGEPILTNQNIPLKINDYPNLIQDVTVINNEIYVLDQPLITNQWGQKIRGAQVSVFDMNGVLLRTFSFYGTGTGQMIRPRGITSDSGGNLYITDSFLNAVICFDKDGSFLGMIQTPTNPMLTTMGIALGQDRRLFAASLNTSSVYVFGLQGYISMNVSPSELSFTAQEGQSNPSPQTLTITNSGTGTLTYEATSTESRIVISGASATVGPGDSGILSIGVDISGLSAATYNGNVTIIDSSGAQEVIPVTLEITAPPEPPLLTVTPHILNYTYKIGDPEPSSQTVAVEISNGTATWTAAADSPWISIVPITGTGDVTYALVRVNPANLAEGNYTGDITIDAPKATGSPVNVEVNLTVIYSGTIQVRCNTPEASFTIAGPLKYEGSGTNWTATEVSDGAYTITYNPVIGYRTPKPETKTISGSGTISFEGNYISLAMSAEIVASKGADNKTLQTIGIFNKSGTLSASFTPFAGSKYNFDYGVNIAVGDIDGDGKSDIVAALGESSKNPAEVVVYRADGTVMPGSDFIAMNTMYGANVAVADFDGDGKAEIVVTAGPGSKNPARVRIFKYENGEIKDTGIDFIASKAKDGVNIAAGDVNGDGIPELITAGGAGSSSASPDIRVWKINTTGPSWSVIDTGIRLIFSGGHGVNVTTGDLNGDGISEIIVSSEDIRSGTNIIKAFYGNGTEFGLPLKYLPAGYGLNLAAADLDGDSIAEIVAGPGPHVKGPALVRIYKADGTLLNTFTAFDNVQYGIAVSAGELGY